MATRELTRHSITPRTRTTTDRFALAMPLLALGVLTLLGAALRLFRLDEMSLRNDESFTLLYARQSWPAVVGFDGFYDFHPPGSFALAKLADLFVPELVASRTISVTVGIATIPVFFALATRLLDLRAALVTTALLAVSPAHIEYSRIGRMYASVTFLVVCSYLALVAFRQDGRRAWAVLYGASLAGAVYVDYSAVYALLPQTIPLLYVIRERWPMSRWLLGVAVGAVVAYLPWVATQMGPTVELANEYTRRASYLAASWERIEITAVRFVGLDGATGRNGGWQDFWTRWPDWHALLVIGVAATAIAGLIALRRAPFSLLIIACLLLGTPLVSISMSLVSPGFDLRTIIPAVPGWCLLIAAPLSIMTRPRVIRIAGLIGCAYLLLVSVSGISGLYSNAGRTLRYDQISETLVDVAPMGRPVLTFSTGGMDTEIIDAHEGDQLAGTRFLTFVDGNLETASAMSRWLDSGPSKVDLRDQGLATYLPPDDPANDAFWFVTHRSPMVFHREFNEAGYARLLRLDYGRAYLELWALPGADLGEPVAIGELANWTVSPKVTATIDESIESLTIPPTDGAVTISQRFDGMSPGLYVFAVDVAGAADSAAGATIQCRSPRGDILAANQHPEGEPAVEGGEPSTFGPAVLCPDETTAVMLLLSSTGETPVTFRNPRLSYFRT